MTLVLFILLLSVLITVHEAGHLIAAKAFGVYCKEFSVGMGPLLFQRQHKETLYSLRLIPIGGYLAMAGESENETDEDLNIPKERTLLGISPLKRIVVQASGIIMNLVLAILLIGSVFLINGVYPAAPEPVVQSVIENSPAAGAGFMENDHIVEIEFADGVSIKPKTMNDLTNFMALYEMGEITFTVLRNNEEVNLKLIPAYNEVEERYTIGIYSNPYTYKEVNLLNCWIYAVDYSLEMFRSLGVAVSQIARGSLQSVSGPVGMYEVTDEIVQLGFVPYLLLMGVISLNLGFMNALPVPILDGGRILITLIEMIIRRPIPKNLEAALMMMGVLLMFGLMIAVTFKDIFS